MISLDTKLKTFDSVSEDLNRSQKIVDAMRDAAPNGGMKQVESELGRDRVTRDAMRGNVAGQETLEWAVNNAIDRFGRTRIHERLMEAFEALKVPKDK